MDKSKLEEKLSKKEIDFCQLLAFGCEPYAGNVTLCYQDIFHDTSKVSRLNAQQLMDRENIKAYLDVLRQEASYETTDVKMRLTEKLFKIVDETSTAEYTDRRGTRLSPAPLRSVAVQAAKALMEMYPVKVAQENKLELSGGGDAGITFNVIVPDGTNKDQEKKVLD